MLVPNPNSGPGVSIVNADSNDVGGLAEQYRNWIEYNNGDGVVITGANAQANLVASNTIDSNSMSGVRIDNGAHDNSIGGSVSGSSGIGLAPGNEIDSNLQQGIYITGGSHNNAVWGNRIDGNGTAVPGISGVEIADSHDNSIGGAMVSGSLYSNQITHSGLAASTTSGGVLISDTTSNTFGNAVAANFHRG